MRTVILKHTLPDGSWHHDWLIQTTKGASDRLPTFRTGHDRPDQDEAFEGERIADHRAMYLDYEGEVSGDRGRVERVATGVVSRAEFDTDQIELTLTFDALTIRLEGRQIADERWRFTRA